MRDDVRARLHHASVTSAEKAAAYDEYSELADRCRHSNLGYDDGQPGMIDDIKQRLEEFDRNARTYGQSISNLQAEIARLRKTIETLQESLDWMIGIGP